MQIMRAGERASVTPPADWFTGRVRQDPIVETTDPARVRAALVTFEPGARTNWHRHPLGQTLWIVSGLGWAQVRGGPRQELRPGDSIWIPPGEIHWHGASSRVAMCHLAMHEALDGSHVEWMEPVSDADYAG